jgi:hypothetical protein
MNPICVLAGHQAPRDPVYNSGFHFGGCRRCGRALVRAGPDWRPVPKGHRIVWKSGRHSHSLEPDYADVLPILHREANLPAVRAPFASWCRELVRLRRQRRAGRDPLVAAAAAAEARADAQYPALLVLAALVGAGFQLLFGLGPRRASFD